MMSAIQSYPELKLLLAGYFHEDWQADDADQEAVVNRFVASESHETVQRAIGQLQSVLKSGLSEHELRARVIGDLGSAFDPTSTGGTTQEWLRFLETQLSIKSSR